jgi:hypothetical protein
VTRLIAQHRSGRSDHSRLIWALFMFSRFLTRVHGGQAQLAGGAASSHQRMPDPEPCQRLA